jgi:hypothetical protein
LSAAKKPQLSDCEIEAFGRDGYIVMDRPVFDDEKFARLQEMADTKFAAQDGHPQLIDCPHWKDPVMFDWIFADELLDLVEPLTGPDIAVFASHFLRKTADQGHRVPWHEDSAYWDGRLTPMEVVCVNLALSPSTEENGCMRVIPGSHRHGYSDYHDVPDAGEAVFHLEIDPDQVDETGAVDLVLEPNQLSVHDVRLIHGSRASTSSECRMLFAVRYIPARVTYNRQQDESFPTFLARGSDAGGGHDDDPMKTWLGDFD